MFKLPDSLKKLWDNNKNSAFIILGLLGIALIFLSENINSSPVSVTEETSESYILKLENDLCNILNSIDGAGEVQVMITLESGRETVYAWQEKTSRDRQINEKDNTNRTTTRNTYENEIVTVGASGNKEALVEKTLQPVVQGVIVVCSGGDDINVVSDITNAVSVVLNIPSNRICVIKMQ